MHRLRVSPRSPPSSSTPHSGHRPQRQGLRPVINPPKTSPAPTTAPTSANASTSLTEAVDRHQLTLNEIPTTSSPTSAPSSTPSKPPESPSAKTTTAPRSNDSSCFPRSTTAPLSPVSPDTPDDVVWHPDWQLPRILDIKTGQIGMRFEMTKNPLQFALYAHGTHWWDPITDTVAPGPASTSNGPSWPTSPPAPATASSTTSTSPRVGGMVEIAKPSATGNARRQPGELLEQITPMRAGPTLTAVYPRPDEAKRSARQPDTVRRVLRTAEDNGFARELLDARITWITARCRNIQAASAPATPTPPTASSAASGVTAPISPTSATAAPPPTNRSTPSPPCATRSKPTSSCHSRPPTRGHPQPPKPTRKRHRTP